MSRTPLVPLHRRGLAAAVLALLVAVLGVVGAGPAWAHATLLSTDPGDGAVVTRAPAAITLRFDEAVGTSLGTVEVLAPDGNRVDTGRLQGSRAQVVAPLRPAIPDGTYVVVWRVTSDDGHPEGGSFSFSVGRAGPAARARDLGAPWTTRAGMEVGRLVGYAGLVLALGVLLVVGLTWGAAAQDRRVGRLVRTGWGALAVGTALTLLLEGPLSAGRGPLSVVTSPSLLLDLAGTRYGELHVARLAALVAVTPGAALALAGRASQGEGSARSPRHLALLLGAGVFLGATFAMSGHAGVGAGWPWWSAVDVVHVLAIATWLGGLALVGGVATRRAAAADPEVAEPAQQALLRWSPVAVTAVVVLTATGTLAGARETGSWRALTDTRYGALLLTKVVLVGLMLSLAGAARQRARRGAWSDLRRAVGIEAAIGVVVLVVASTLVTTVPGGAAVLRTRPAPSAVSPAAPER